MKITQVTKSPSHQVTSGFIFVISGPSGSGKSTLLTRLVQARTLNKRIVRSISYTTRPKRSKERDKKDYFFISRRQFKQKLEAKKILEWTKYLGYYYATPKDYLEQQIKRGLDIVMCLDVKGALKVKRLYPENTITIFILPPSLRALKSRISKRCNKTGKDEIAKRLGLAKGELEAAEKYDYCLKNKNLDEAVGKLIGIVLKERTKRNK